MTLKEAKQKFKSYHVPTKDILLFGEYFAVNKCGDLINRHLLVSENQLMQSEDAAYQINGWFDWALTKNWMWDEYDRLDYKAFTDFAMAFLTAYSRANRTKCNRIQNQYDLIKEGEEGSLKKMNDSFKKDLQNEIERMYNVDYRGWVNKLFYDKEGNELQYKGNKDLVRKGDKVVGNLKAFLAMSKSLLGIGWLNYDKESEIWSLTDKFKSNEEYHFKNEQNETT